VFSIEFPDLVSRKFHWWYSFLLPRLAASAQHITTVSEYSKQRIVDRLQTPEEKVSVVSSAVDHRFSLAEPDQVAQVSERYSLPREFILTLSSLEPRKNLERVVNAWLRLDEEDRPPLVIAGGLGVQKVFGSYSIGDLRRHKGIQLLGYVPDEDVAALYSAATIFVYASLLEGFGLPPLEAMACGATVVTSNTSAMKETSGGLAFLVDPNSIESIANGIVEALGTKRSPADRDRLSEYVRDRFNWSNTANQIAKILEQYEEE
jgi:glycosyltransferase involved in cell wall biosynthesis